MESADDCNAACVTIDPYNCLGYQFEQITILDYYKCDCTSCFDPPFGESSTFTLCENDKDYTIAIIIIVVVIVVCLMCCVGCYYGTKNTSPASSNSSNTNGAQASYQPAPTEVPPAYAPQQSMPQGYPPPQQGNMGYPYPQTQQYPPGAPMQPYRTSSLPPYKESQV